MLEFQTQPTGIHWPHSVLTTPSQHPSVSTALYIPDRAHWTGVLWVATQRVMLISTCIFHLYNTFRLTLKSIWNIIKTISLSRRWPSCLARFLLPEHLMGFHQELRKPKNPGSVWTYFCVKMINIFLFSVTFTCRVGPILTWGLARLTIADTIFSQRSEGVVNVWREVQLCCGASTRNLCQVCPNSWLVEKILILDQKFWRR